MGNEIRKYLTKHKYNTASDETYNHIDEWLEWYQNDVETVSYTHLTLPTT